MNLILGDGATVQIHSESEWSGGKPRGAILRIAGSYHTLGVAEAKAIASAMQCTAEIVQTYNERNQR